MTFARCTITIVTAVATLLAIGGAGCRLPGPGPSEPHVDGFWVGRVTSVKVFDPRGREYDAAALQVETGPKDFDTPMPGSNVSFVEYVQRGLGAAWSGRLPLLVPWDVDPRIMSPGRVPLGRKVRVRGSMMVYHAGNPKGSGGEASVARAKAHPAPGFGEHVLFVDGPIRPIQD